jgi:hypothetical protein
MKLKKEPANFRLPVVLKEKMVEIALQQGMTYSEACRLAIMEYVQKHEKQV